MRLVYALALFAALPLAGAGPIPAPLATTPGLAVVCGESGCGPRGARLFRSARGGCFYVNRGGIRTYVDRPCCD